MHKKILGRFAPSPTGRMHLGNIWAALCAYLSVRSQDGEIVLRMEDVDSSRCKPEYAEQIRRDLRLLGLCWESESAPQSRRSAVYSDYLQNLCKRNLLYGCFCTRAELHASSAPQAGTEDPVYTGTCFGMPPDRVEELEKKRTPALRLHVPDEDIRFIDNNYGEMSYNLRSDSGDFVLRRSDGLYSYQFACALDDMLSGVSEVVRGRDLLSSAPRQIYLMRLFGGNPPVYGHVPLLCAPGGRRLSKRDGDFDFGRMLEHGMTPGGVIGMLAHAAGWIDRPEDVMPDELVRDFDWSKIPKEDLYSDRPDIPHIADGGGMW